MPADTSRLATALADRYRIERQLGAGGMATVYLAIDLKHDREVALKVLRPELGAVLGDERFLAEIKITAKLDHPHILTLIDSGVAEGYLYYVLPLVRGESLRDKLNRDKQLGVEEAVTLTKQVAGALDYAHRHGVVHRDIKPENILIQEGEAMLTDFGIALAVSEAGGDRLTETGLSLGTPQYMSPEQATGDRLLSARSDVYSLGAVLYEMLAGEPPVTGPTSQAMIAKLMTEKPVSLRVVRPSTPEAIDLAVQKALDKTPADRFASAGDFARALDLKTVTATQPAAPERRSGAPKIVAGATILALVLAGAFFARGKLGASSERGGPYVLKDRTQLTYTGQVFSSAITPDGKQLAYITRQCTGTGCTYAVEIQDVGGTATHRVLEGATSSYGLEWSPDRRNLIFYGTYKNRFGAYLVSALGEAPRYLTSTSAMFWAGGDSLIVAPATANDSVYWLKVMSLTGAVGDSIAVRDPDFGEGTSIGAVGVMPNGRWIVANVIKRSRGLWRVIDRQGTVASEVLNSCTCGGRMSDNGLWLARSGAGFESIIRIGIDSATGSSPSGRTRSSPASSTPSASRRRRHLVYDDGTSDDQLWATELGGAPGGKFPDDRRLARSPPAWAWTSPLTASGSCGRQTPVAYGGVDSASR
ncbi:MAG: serine/threonine-protein kinase [Gemmatimonadetes bacterium]|nr:serine/threonine-protein kinase [Gemmatimonadota bacterium]